MQLKQTAPIACLVTFVSAAVVDGLMAQWVSAVAHGQALRAAGLSMACATALLLGIGKALRGRWPALTWVLGYGVGSYVAVVLSR